MANEFTMSNHSGSAPSDLRLADPRPRPVDTTAEQYRAVLEARGDHDIAAMLFDPIREATPKVSHKAKRHARAVALAEHLGGAA